MTGFSKVVGKAEEKPGPPVKTLLSPAYQMVYLVRKASMVTGEFVTHAIYSDQQAAEAHKALIEALLPTKSAMGQEPVITEQVTMEQALDMLAAERFPLSLTVKARIEQVEIDVAALKKHLLSHDNEFHKVGAVLDEILIRLYALEQKLENNTLLIEQKGG